MTLSPRTQGGDGPGPGHGVGRWRAALFAVALLGLGAAGCGQVAAPESPAVYELAPTTARVGDTVRIDGQGFGDLQADGFVSVHGTLAEVTAWSDGRIELTVPQVPAGATVVVVSVAGRTSAPVDLSIVPAS